LVECIALLYLCGIWSCSDVKVSGGKQDVVLKKLFTFTDPFPILAIADLPLRRLPILQHSWAQLDGSFSIVHFYVIFLFSTYIWRSLHLCWHLEWKPYVWGDKIK
jgi:hypothetical protein